MAAPAIVSSASGYGTTSSFDSRGALAIIAFGYCYENLGSLTDNQGNSYTLRSHGNGASTDIGVYECLNPTTSATHTVSMSGPWSAVSAVAISGTHTSPFDVEDSAITQTTPVTNPLAVGPITTTVDDCLILTGLSVQGNVTLSAPSGYTRTTYANQPMSGAVAYKTLASAGNASASWYSTLTHKAASIIAYKPEAAAAGNRRRRLLLGCV